VNRSEKKETRMKKGLFEVIPLGYFKLDGALCFGGAKNGWCFAVHVTQFGEIIGRPRFGEVNLLTEVETLTPAEKDHLPPEPHHLGERTAQHCCG